MFNLSFISSSLQLISLIIITGGTITIGALAAPTLFNSLSREEAGSVMVDIFNRFDNWIKVSAIILLSAKIIEMIFVKPTFNAGGIITLLLVIGIAAISFYMAFVLSPQINTAYETDDKLFLDLHKQSELLHRVNFLLGLVLLASFAV
ncbi:MAG: DUF4149 domain-containing protein [Candidatus Caenarcaniphilales bacterium]|jgi:uncharacterized membrane protein|nr:DUF4149 domain-containing protein [Candidatus Caenarcaniphilales bacterium]